MNPSISIIIPVYNVESYLERCVDSVLAQTFEDFEVILVNDGSTDNSPEICDEYLTVDNRIKIIHKDNGGLSSARNSGLDIATGRYIMFVDSDDWIERNMCQLLYDRIVNTECKMICCELFYETVRGISVNNSKYDCIMSSSEALDIIMYQKAFDLTACVKLLNRDLFEDERFPIGKLGEDNFLITRLICKCNQIYLFSEPLYHYNMTTESICRSRFSEKKMDILEQTLLSLNYVEENLPSSAQAAKSRTAYICIWLLTEALVDCSDRKNMKILLKMLRKYFVYYLRNPYKTKKEKAIAIMMCISPKIYKKVYLDKRTTLVDASQMRTKKTAKNVIYGLLAQIIIILMSFINRTIFINVLGADYLGVNGLFSNIFMMLSLSELGLGSAIIYSLYKPIAEKNQQKIKALMNFYSFSYRIVGITVFGMGVLLIPFLDRLIKDQPNIPYLTYIYVLYLINSSISYFWTYKRSIIIANQDEYINTINNTLFGILKNILQVLLLIVTKSFILYLVISILCTILSNIHISYKANTMYPYLKGNREKLSKIEVKELFRYVMAQMSHKVGDVVVNGTDNLLISSFVGVFYVGLYSNYILVIGIIRTFLNICFNAATASVGNLNATEGSDRTKQVYYKMFFLNASLFGCASLCELNLVNDFIVLWIGPEYLLKKSIVLLIVINFYLMGMRQTTVTFKDTAGLFWNDRYKPLFESVLNLIFSIVLLKRFGVAGVFLGTLFSTLATCFWIEPYVLYKHRFRTPLREFFRIYVKYALVTIFSGIVSAYLCNLFINISIINWFIKCVITVVVYGSINIIVYRNTEEFGYYLNLLKLHQKKNSNL